MEDTMKVGKLIFGILAILLVFSLIACASAPAIAPIGDATGTATASAPGYGGEVTVTVTMVNGFITEVVAIGPDESPTIGGAAIMRAPPRIIRFNTTDIDIVSGASITTMAITEAAQKAIDMIVAGE